MSPFPCGNSSWNELAAHTLVPFANEEPILLVKGGKHDSTSCGTRWRKNAKFIAPAVFAASDATVAIWRDPNDETKYKRRDAHVAARTKEGWHVGFPRSPPPVTVFLDPPRAGRKKLPRFLRNSQPPARLFLNPLIIIPSIPLKQIFKWSVLSITTIFERRRRTQDASKSGIHDLWRSLSFNPSS